MYVVYYCEHLKDGIEEGGRIVPTVAAALQWIELVSSGFGGSNTGFRLFEVGKEIPLKKVATEKLQPPKIVETYVVDVEAQS